VSHETVRLTRTSADTCESSEHSLPLTSEEGCSRSSAVFFHSRHNTTSVTQTDRNLASICFIASHFSACTLLPAALSSHILLVLKILFIKMPASMVKTGTKSANSGHLNKNYPISTSIMMWYFCKHFGLKIPNGHGNNNETLSCVTFY